MNLSGFTFTVSLFYFQLANVWTDERIISTNSTLENIYFKIFKTSRDLIGNTITEPILEENKKVMIGNSLNDSKKNVRYYESLSTREKEIFESKIGVLLEMYSKLKDLMFHDVRSFFNFLRGKWSYYSLDRLLRVNIDTFRDAKYKIFDVVQQTNS